MSCDFFHQSFQNPIHLMAVSLSLLRLFCTAVYIHTPLPSYSTLFFLTEYNMFSSRDEMLYKQFLLPTYLFCTAAILFSVFCFYL